jgi:ATP-binding cassette subfamily B protein
MIAFGWVINIVQRGIASWERMLEVMDAEADHALRTSTSELRNEKRSAPRIDVRHLTFRYPGAATDALEDVSFVVDPGHTVALVGATGCGKSTILSLLPRIYNPPAGTIFVDGVDITTLPLDELRRGIGVVPQEPFLFSDTVGGNIAFGLAGPADRSETRARVTRAAELAGLAADIAGFPAGYDTKVGERGITLSGGQKQRAAIARAIAIDPRILLLDDALSSVDTSTEEAILRELAAVRRARTCLVVAHRISTVRDADQILVLRDGRVAERGTHDELVARGGLYADMHRRQLLEEEIAAIK